MLSLHVVEGLPELLGYRLRRIMTGPDKLLKPFSRDKVFERYIAGFLVFVYLRTDNPDTRVVVDLYGDGTLDIVLSPRKLYEDGLVSPNPGSAWLARYDDTERVYVALFTPSPWLPWNGFGKVFIENPTDTETKYTFIAWVLEKPGG